MTPFKYVYVFLFFFKEKGTTYVLSTLVPLALLLLGYSSRHTNTPAALVICQGRFI